MHRDEHVRLELLDLSHDLLEVVGRRRTEMESPDDRMNFLDTRHLLRLSHRIDDADVAAGRDHNEAFAADVEAGGVLVDGLVRPDFSLQLSRRVGPEVATG